MSKKDTTQIKTLLDRMIDKDLQAVMQGIMDMADVSADIKASRVGLASTAMHHLKLLRAALG
jgi:hypothetical protein